MLTPDAVGIIQGAGRKAKAAKKTAKKAPPKPPATKTEAVTAQVRKAGSPSAPAGEACAGPADPP